MDFILPIIDFFTTRIPNFPAFLLWITLFFISWISIKEILFIINQSKENVHFKKAMNSSFLLGLLINSIIFYTSPSIPSPNSEWYFLLLEMALSLAIGVFFPSLWKTKHGGDFFAVLTLSILLGFTWYVRVTSPASVFNFGTMLMFGFLSRYGYENLILSSKSQKNREVARLITLCDTKEQHVFYMDIFRYLKSLSGEEKMLDFFVANANQEILAKVLERKRQGKST